MKTVTHSWHELAHFSCMVDEPNFIGLFRIGDAQEVQKEMRKYGNQA